MPPSFRPPIHLFVAHRHASVRQMVSDQLAGTGITVIGETDDGRDAVEQLIALAPDVALLGVDLPTVDGTAACRALRTELPACRVLLLADEDDDAALAGLTAGAYGCYLLGRPSVGLAEAVRGTMRRESLPTARWAQQVLDGYIDLVRDQDSRIVPPPKLTATEEDLLQAFAAGHTPQRIAETREMTTHMVRVHVTNGIAKLSRALADEQLVTSAR